MRLYMSFSLNFASLICLRSLTFAREGFTADSKMKRPAICVPPTVH